MELIMSKLNKDIVSNMSLKEVIQSYCRIKNGVDDDDIAESIIYLDQLIPLEEFLEKKKQPK